MKLTAVSHERIPIYLNLSDEILQNVAFALYNEYRIPVKKYIIKILNGECTCLRVQN